MLNTVLATFSEGTPPIPPSSFESIQTVTGTGGASSVTFTSIPSTYKSLQVRGLAVSPSGYTYAWNFNSDTTVTNYVNHYLEGNGSTASAGAAVSSGGTYFALIGQGTLATYPNTFIADLIDYANTSKYKTIRTFYGADNNSTAGSIGLSSNLWKNTAAISAITITGNFIAGSTFALYGIKG